MKPLLIIVAGVLGAGPGGRTYQGPADVGQPPPEPENADARPSARSVEVHEPTYTPPRPLYPPRDGKRALTFGLVMVGLGAASGLLRTTSGFILGGIGSHEAGVAYGTGGLMAPTFFFTSLPFLGVGIRRLRYWQIHESVVRNGLRPVAAPSRARGLGIGMAVAGSLLLASSWILLFDPLGDVALWAGAPLAVGGVLVAGDSRGRALGVRDYGGPHVVPVATRPGVSLSLYGRF